MKNALSDRLIDAACILSVVGIWPRFIEPNLLKTTRLSLTIPNLPPQLENFKILQMSDLHMNPSLSDHLLGKILNKTSALKPDMIVHTGDFLCRSKIVQKKRLHEFLSSFEAPYGCFAVLGNHDYANWISVNASGDYDAMEDQDNTIPNGINRLKRQIHLSGKLTASQPEHNDEFVSLLDKTCFQLLHNSTVQVSVNGSFLNVSGLGEYTAGHLNPSAAFSNYDSRYPGVVLSHNPDSVPTLKEYPGDLIVCGHTHGAQINLPWIWKRITLMENNRYKRGLKHESQKWIYINRGVGGVSPIRCFSTPEITLFTLKSQ